MKTIRISDARAMLGDTFHRGSYGTSVGHSFVRLEAAKRAHARWKRKSSQVSEIVRITTSNDVTVAYQIVEPDRTHDNEHEDFKCARCGETYLLPDDGDPHRCPA
jgi:hypothetical protein